MAAIAICNYRELEKVCGALGLSCKQTKKGVIWHGTLKGDYVRISIHIHQRGKDIPTGLFRSYVRDLKFENVDDFLAFSREI